jgi:hypothetical protein
LAAIAIAAWGMARQEVAMDVLVVAVPTQLHRELTCAALFGPARGVHTP